MGFGDSHALQGSHQRLQRPIGDQISQPIAKKKDAGTSHMLLKLSKTRSHFARRTNKVINSELEPDQNIIIVQREVNRTKKKRRERKTRNERGAGSHRVVAAKVSASGLFHFGFLRRKMIRWRRSRLDSHTRLVERDGSSRNTNSNNNSNNRNNNRNNNHRRIPVRVVSLRRRPVWRARFSVGVQRKPPKTR